MCHSISTSTTASSPILSLHDVVCYFCNIDKENVNAVSNFTNLGRSIELYFAQDVSPQLRETLCDGKESSCNSDISLECITCIAQLLMNKHLPPLELRDSISSVFETSSGKDLQVYLTNLDYDAVKAFGEGLYRISKACPI